MSGKEPEEAESLKKENDRLREIISELWPIVTKHTKAEFWVPIENELRNGRCR